MSVCICGYIYKWLNWSLSFWKLTYNAPWWALKFLQGELFLLWVLGDFFLLCVCFCFVFSYPISNHITNELWESGGCKNVARKWQRKIPHSYPQVWPGLSYQLCKCDSAETDSCLHDNNVHAAIFANLFLCHLYFVNENETGNSWRQHTILITWMTKTINNFPPWNLFRILLEYI